MLNQTFKSFASYFWILFIAAAFTSACASTGESTGEAEAAGSDEDNVESPSGSKLPEDRVTTESSVEELLEGRVSGVSVVRTPNGPQLRIRGNRTFRGSNRPLIMVNGVPVSEGYGGAIPVNPYDIASIRVLKNAAETAFYGARGRNGVILIETKRGE